MTRPRRVLGKPPRVRQFSVADRIADVLRESRIMGGKPAATEVEWLTSRAPKRLLSLVKDTASTRRLRLYACACCRGIWDVLEDRRARRAVEVAERYAADDATERDRAAAEKAAWQYADSCHRSAASVAAAWTVVKSDAMARLAATICSLNARSAVRGGKLRDFQVEALRCIFGNPFGPAPVIDPAWLKGNDGLAVRLATAAYEDRAFDRLPVLADALEDAGCDHAELLAHLRGPGPHVLGCWALDHLLGRS